MSSSVIATLKHACCTPFPTTVAGNWTVVGSDKVKSGIGRRGSQVISMHVVHTYVKNRSIPEEIDGDEMLKTSSLSMIPKRSTQI